MPTTASPDRPGAGPARRLGGRLLPVLAWVTVGLLVLGAAAVHLDEVVRRDRDVPGAPLAVARLLDLNRETSIPTWFSVVLLLLLAATFAVSSALSTRPASGAYAALAVAAGWMSLDEAATVHELLAGAGRDLVPQGDQLTGYVWLLPGAVAAAVAGVLLLGLARALPPWQRRALVLAGMLFLTGAVAVEATAAAVHHQVGPGARLLLTVAEEGCEMAAVLVALRAATAALMVRRTSEGLHVTLEREQPLPARGTRAGPRRWSGGTGR